MDKEEQVRISIKSSSGDSSSSSLFFPTNAVFFPLSPKHHGFRGLLQLNFLCLEYYLDGNCIWDLANNTVPRSICYLFFKNSRPLVLFISSLIQ